MKLFSTSILAFAFLSAFMPKADAQSGWYSVTSGTTARLNAIFIPDYNVVILGNSGVVIRRISPDTNFVMQYISGARGLRGLGENYAGYYWICGDSGEVFYTTDVGATWQTKSISGITLTLRAFIANGGQQYALGDSGKIFDSNTNGASWTLETPVTTHQLNFTLYNPAVAVGNSGTIIRSTDLGSAWLIDTSGTTRQLYSVTYGGSGIVVASGAQGTIVRSTDLGVTWSLVSSGTTLDLYGCGSAPGVYLACGPNGTILKSTDNGVTWGRQATPTTETLYGINALSPTNYFAVGANGTFLETKDGGGTVAAVEHGTSETPGTFRLEQNYPDPFNPTTIIDYQLAVNSAVTLTVYDGLGRIVKTLVNEHQDAGSYSITFDGSNLPSGVYFYRLQTGTYGDTKKLLLLK